MRALILRELPLFSTFFFSSVGYGGMQIARPLFSASFGVSLFLVALVSASGAIARLIAAPIAGLLTDRVGRRPLVMSGLALRVLSGILSFWADSYEQFLFLEFAGSIGLAVWNTGANVIIADVTQETNRGRAVALRSISQRLGVLFGPALAGVLAARFGLRSIFLLNAGGKGVALLIFVFLIRETKPTADAARALPPGRTGESVRATPEERASLTAFLTRPFLVVALATLSVWAIGSGGAFEVLFPLHATQAAGLDTVNIGQMVTVLSFASLVASFPNGFILDRIGRKASIVPGLLVLAVAAYLLAGIHDFWTVLIAVVLMGIGEGMAVGSTQVLAMDLAPARRRGAFLGMWQLVNNIGSTAAPLALGAVAQFWDFGTAFTAIAISLVGAALVMAFLGPETRKTHHLEG